MKIESFTIFGYGKWIDQTFEVQSDFHVFFGKNEAGKSTLMSFLHSILFGFPARNSQYSRYEPKESSRYGGEITFSHSRLGEGSIKRVSGKSSGDVTVELADGTSGEDDLAEALVFDIDRNLYKQLFSFQLKDLEAIYQLKEEDINRYFISAGMLGSKEYIKQADWLSQQAGKLYKPSGRVPSVNKQLKLLKKKQKKLASAKEKNEEYLEIANKISQIESENKDIETSLLEESKRLEQLKSLESEWEVKEEIDQLKVELRNNQIVDLPKEGMYQLKSLNSQIDLIREKRRKNQEKFDELKMEHKPSELFLTFKENEQAIEDFESKQNYINSEYNKLTGLTTEKDYLENTLNKELTIEGIESAEQLPETWSKEKNKELEDWQKQFSDKKAKKEHLDKEHDYNSFQMEVIQQDVDDLEEKMWAGEDQQKVQTKTSHLSIFGPFALGLIFFLSFFLMAQTFLSVVSLLASGGLFIIGGINLYKQKGKESNLQKADESDYKNLWRNKLAQMDELVSKQNENTKELNILENEMELIVNQFNQFKKTHSLRNNLTLEEVLRKREKYEELKKTKEKLDKNYKKIESIENNINTLLEPLSFIEEYFPVQNTIESKLQSYMHFIRKVNEEEKFLDQFVKNSEKIQNHNDQLNKEEAGLSNDKINLLKSAGVNNEEAFRDLFSKQEENRRKENRVKELQERFKNPEELESFGQLDDLKAEIQSLNAHKEAMNRKEKENIEEKASYKYDIDRLEEGSEYTYLLQDYENEKSKLQDLLDEWMSKKIAASLIRKTLDKGNQEQLPYILEDANYFFSKLTNNNYSEIIIDDNEIKVKAASGNTYYTSELSRGTAEPLYVALRFAFIKNISTTLKLPIIIDDGFVNFDDDRREAIYELLEEMSNYTQILYFTFDETIFSHVNKNQWTMLK